MAEDRHKFKPIRVRPRELDRLWLAEHSAATGRAVNAIVADAIAAYRASLGGPTASGPTTVSSGPTAEPSGPTTEKQPKRAQAQESPPGSARSAGCPHPKARILKGLCGACGTYVG